MAKTNKYTSINFNHVIDKNLTSSSSASRKNPRTNHQTHSPFASYSSASNVKTHGRMLVLTRPSPNPVTTPPPPPVLSPTLPNQPQPRSASVSEKPTSSDRISLRPGSGISSTGLEKKEKEVVSVSGSVKSVRFVPPHLRPGFAGKEEKPEPKVLRGREQGVKHFGSSGYYGEHRRPKSGGYDKIKRGGDSDLGLIPRPRSSGNRPGSSG